jgi:UPF0716 protein FxsA
MIRLLALLFIIVPALEIWVILQTGEWIGGWETFLLIVAAGVLGAYLSKRETAKIWAEAQRQLSMGQMPGQSILDGLCVLVGGILLMTPGFLSDFVGIFLVLPFTRPFFRRLLYNWIRRRLDRGQTFYIFRR